MTDLLDVLAEECCSRNETIARCRRSGGKMLADLLWEDAKLAIEYDSADGGHVLIILPEGVELPVLEIRGMGFKRLAKLVHKNGGIIGAAHPYGTGYFAIANTWLYKKDPSIMEEFDFVEAYNSGLKRWRNRKARALAMAWDKPMTSGSDAHWESAFSGGILTAHEIRSTEDYPLIVRGGICGLIENREDILFSE